MERNLLLKEIGGNTLEREIFSPGKSVLVTNTLITPYRWICKIGVRYFDPNTGQGGTSEGTGILISPCHVLTNAHVLLGIGKPVSHTKFGKIEIRPGLNGKDVFGKYESTQFQVHPNYGKEKPIGNLDFNIVNAIWDYGIIKLKENIGFKTFDNIGGPLGYWGQYGNGSLVRLNENCVYGIDAIVSGYPAQSLAISEDNGVVNKIINVPEKFWRRLISYKINTEHSQSGSPVWVNAKVNNCSIPILIGLHTFGNKAANGGVRITYEVLNQIAKMKDKLK